MPKNDKGVQTMDRAVGKIDPILGIATSRATAFIRFKSKLMKPAGGSAGSRWMFLRLPIEASEQLPSRGLVTVEGAVKSVPFVATLQPDGEGGHWFKVSEELSKAASIASGDVVEMLMSPVTEEPEPEIPDDFEDALSVATPIAIETWAKITSTARRDWIHWIVSGKKAETRVSRIATACDMLGKGKRRPCCFDSSGMYSKSLSCPKAAED